MLEDVSQPASPELEVVPRSSIKGLNRDPVAPLPGCPLEISISFGHAGIPFPFTVIKINGWGQSAYPLLLDDRNRIVRPDMVQIER